MPLPHIPKTAAQISVLARRSLPLLSGLFLELGGFRLAVASKVRAFYHLFSQAEAFQLLRFAEEFAAGLSQIEIDTIFGNLSPLDIPLDPNAFDPFDRGTRYYYEFSIEFGGKFFHFDEQTDSILTRDEINQLGFDEAQRLADFYPAVAEHLESEGATSFTVRISQVSRRF